jgi:hypothetical protein
MITTVDRNGSVTFGVRAGCQYESECDVKNECECERCRLCGEHVGVTGEKRDAQITPDGCTFEDDGQD